MIPARLRAANDRSEHRLHPTSIGGLISKVFARDEERIRSLVIAHRVIDVVAYGEKIRFGLRERWAEHPSDRGKRLRERWVIYGSLRGKRIPLLVQAKNAPIEDGWIDL